MAELSSEWMTALDDYVQGFRQEALDAATAATEHLLRVTQEAARGRAGWDHLADNIEVWSEDGELVIGVMDSAFASEAFALEYGDEENAPNPLFRTLKHERAEADQVYADHLINRGVADRA